MTPQDTLVRVVMDLSQVADLNDVTRIVKRAARELTGADGATFVVREGDVCHYVDEDAIGPLWKGRRFPMATCISGWAMEHGQAAVVEDVFADPRIPVAVYEPTFVRSVLMVPIRARDPMGAIGAYWARPHRASPEEVGLVQALADSTAVAIENVSARNEARRWRALLAEASDTLWTLDPLTGAGEPGVRKWWSGITGRPESDYEDPSAWLDDLHPEDQAAARAAWAASTGAPTPLRMSYRLRGRDGSYRHLAVRGVPVARPDGTYEFVGMINDVTREREAETEVRTLLARERRARDAAEEAQQTLDQHLHRVSDGFVAIDRDWRYTYVNERATQILGHPRERILGQQVWTLFPEARGTAVHRAMERALATQQPVFEDASSPWGRYFENRIYPSETGLSIFFNDLTEARRLHGEVVAERRRLQRLAECVGAAIVMVSAPSGELVYSNRRAASLLELGVEGPAATRSPITVDLAESGGPLGIVATVLRTGAPVPDQEISHVGRDGRPVTLLASAVPVEGDDGHLEGVVASFHDVTQGREAREALRHLSRRLLAAQDEERRRISLDLHDDFAQVLTAVKMTLVGLRSGGESSDESVRNAVEIVDRSIGQIRDLSLRLHPPMLDMLGLGPTLRWYVEERLRNTAVRPHLSLEIKGSRFGSVIENACFRVVQEAVTNVLRHADARELRVQVRKEARGLLVAVRDDGRGFEPATARAEAVSGEHAGLAGMQERVALAGGTLEVCSKPGGGTEVRARFALEAPK